jgi:hypothetical protein
VRPTHARAVCASAARGVRTAARETQLARMPPPPAAAVSVSTQRHTARRAARACRRARGSARSTHTSDARGGARGAAARRRARSSWRARRRRPLPPRASALSATQRTVQHAPAVVRAAARPAGSLVARAAARAARRALRRASSSWRAATASAALCAGCWSKRRSARRGARCCSCRRCRTRIRYDSGARLHARCAWHRGACAAAAPTAARTPAGAQQRHVCVCAGRAPRV